MVKTFKSENSVKELFLYSSIVASEKMVCYGILSEIETVNNCDRHFSSLLLISYCSCNSESGNSSNLKMAEQHVKYSPSWYTGF